MKISLIINGMNKRLDGIDSIWSSRLDRFIELGIGLARPTVAEMADVWCAQRASRACERCGQMCGIGERTPSGCSSCRGISRILDGVITLGTFSGLLADGIRALKYRGRWELAGVLGEHLGSAVETFLLKDLPRREWVVVPMPMPFWRRMERGVDHARLIADSMGSKLGMSVLQPLKKASGVPQMALSRTKRKSARRADFRIYRKGVSGFGGKLPSLKGKSVILVDDVLTTGRSMRAAGSALRRLGPISIHAAALAVSKNRAME